MLPDWPMSVNINVCFSDDEVEDGNGNPPSDPELDVNKEDKKEVQSSVFTCLFVCLFVYLFVAVVYPCDSFQVSSGSERSEVKPVSGLKVRTP